MEVEYIKDKTKVVKERGGKVDEAQVTSAWAACDITEHLHSPTSGKHTANPWHLSGTLRHTPQFHLSHGDSFLCHPGPYLPSWAVLCILSHLGHSSAATHAQNMEPPLLSDTRTKFSVNTKSALVIGDLIF